MRTVNIDTSKVIATPNKKMWGIFYEEINHAGEGGLYAELIRNRNFSENDVPENTRYIPSRLEAKDGKFVSKMGYIENKKGFKEDLDLSEPLPGWSFIAEPGVACAISKITDEPRNPECPDQLKMFADGPAKLVNSGFWGITAKKQKYNGFIILKSKNVSSVRVGLMRKNGTELGSTVIRGIKADFGKFEYSFSCKDGDSDARFFIEPKSAGTVIYDFVSMFPEDTYCAEKNGFRKDILEFLKAMKPGFLRFPGGCVVEGVTLDNAIHWKKTVGPIEDRPGHWNLWHYRFSDGLGMYEYCRLGEILDADLMYVCNCGMSCQGRGSELAEGETLQYWLQNALDGIEYICGGADTEWGSLRAKHGHPEPFNLKYVEIGNENWGPDYEKHFDIFCKAIREKYPELVIISTCKIEGADYDLRDDHYYTAPGTFPCLCNRYDNDIDNIYVGEYACNSWVGYGNLLSAVSEACFMTHMENRGDRVRIASYAPLFCHENDRRWPVNLINFDRGHVFGIPSYYVQKLFSENAVDKVVDTDCEVRGGEEDTFVTVGIAGNDLVIKVANISDKAQKMSFVCPEITAGSKKLNLISGEKPEDTNTLLYPEYVATSVSDIKCENGKVDIVLPPYSFAVIR